MGIDPRQHQAHVRMWGAVIKLAIRDADRLAQMRDQPDIFKLQSNLLYFRPRAKKGNFEVILR